jgi:Lon protease-like protein
MRLRLFPLRAVLFPGTVLNLHIFEPRYLQMIRECIDGGDGFGVVLISEGAEAGDPDVVPHEIGSVAQIVDVTALPLGRFYISTVGRARFRIRKIVNRDPYLIAEADMLEDDGAEADDDGLADRVREQFTEYLKLLVEISGRSFDIDLPADARGTSYVIGDALQVADPIKQRLLESNGTVQRLTMELSFLERVLPQLRALNERRRVELEARGERVEDANRRREQEKFFGRSFSEN